MWQKFKNIYHLCVAVAANVWFGFPSRNIIVVGVTGTDGKTTTTSLLYHILNVSGQKASMISSVGAIINNRKYSLPFHVTTLPPFALQSFIKMAARGRTKNKKIYLVLEVTSHALDQYRIFGTSFNVGLITNVSHEHLDYHKTYKEYVNTKVKLLNNSKTAIINKDDRAYKLISPILKKNRSIERIITYGLKNGADINSGNFIFETSLLGDFNKHNVLAAVTAARVLGLRDGQIRKAVSSFVPPVGRQDVVHKKDFSVMIDFAHTPNSFDRILDSLRPKVSGRLIHVFGSAGQRDRTKRPEMGKTSSEYSDLIIITSEDPRSENVEDINKEILSGIEDASERLEQGKIQIIPDRQKAIEEAIAIAKKGDFVIITGKAHEKAMNYGKGEVPWDEYKVVKRALQKRNEKN